MVSEDIRKGDFSQEVGNIFQKMEWFALRFLIERSSQELSKIP